MSFLKSILSPFVEFKESQNKETVKTSSPNDGKSKLQWKNFKQSSSRSDSLQAADQVEVSMSRDANSTYSNNNYHQHFEDLIQEANASNPLFQGTDFKEFVESKIDLQAIPDEESRYRTAFNVLKRTGLTKERLVNTGREYLKIVDEDLRGFSEAFAVQYKNEIEDKERLLRQKEQEHQALLQKLATLKQEISDISKQISNNKSHLTSNRNLFISAGEYKKKEIENELEKINQYFS